MSVANDQTDKRVRFNPRFQEIENTVSSETNRYTHIISSTVQRIAHYVLTHPVSSSKSSSKTTHPTATNSSSRKCLNSRIDIVGNISDTSHGVVDKSVVGGTVISAMPKVIGTCIGMDSGAVAFNMSSRTSGNFMKRKQDMNFKDGDGRYTTTEECDSTTEPVTKVQFQVGEDVYFQEETGQNILGTVGMIQGRKIKIIFGDATERWAPMSRVKKISFSFMDDEDEDRSKSVSQTQAPLPMEPVRGLGSGTGVLKKKQSKFELNGLVSPKEVTCGSCGTQKMITPKKAIEFSPFTSHQYNCRKCINKSKTSKNNGVPIIHHAHYLAAARGRPRTADTNGAMTSAKGHIMEHHHGISNGVYRPPENDPCCLHCRNKILEKVSLHCTMCERPCHPSCLALTPPPLPGDIFWSIICHSCGTQKSDDSVETVSQKVYSSRRSITCWSDVAYLLLSCLGCKNPTERFFDLDDQIIPFWEENVARLHLPRQYKTAESLDRRKYLLTALNNANLRFAKDEKKKSPVWAIKDRQYNRGYHMLIKPPAVGTTGRAVTAAGFPISVRANNPEATTVAMTNIAQTIATQAAANKASGGIPIPKNSPSNISPKALAKSSGAPPVVIPGRKLGKGLDQLPVAKKTGSELNSGVQRVNNKSEVWTPQSRYNHHGVVKSVVQEQPKASSNSSNNNIVGNSGVETVPSSLAAQIGSPVPSGNRLSQSQQQQQPQSHFLKQGSAAGGAAVLSPSAGGAARVTGVVISPSSSSSSSSSGTDYSSGRLGMVTPIGSYPVRKNGSPMLNKSISVERKREVTSSPFHHSDSDSRRSEEFIRESPGFINQSNNHRLQVKRKISPSAATVDNCSRTPEGLPAKKVKMSLPSSTDVTSRRVPSPSKSPELLDSKCLVDSPNNGQKKSPLIQKLSDLLRQGNGGLTIARLTHTESGVQTVAINPSTLEDSIDSGVSNAEGRQDGYPITLDKSGQLLQTPTKNSYGASSCTPSSTSKIVQSEKVATEGQDTKEKASNVTTSPRAFKLASVSPAGTSKSASPLAERRMTRPVRLRRTVVANAEAQKQSKESSIKTGKKINGKSPTVAAAALVAAKTRGRPKKFKLHLRRPNSAAVPGVPGHFNGSAESSSEATSSSATINETEFVWQNSSIKDLLEHGHGYRLECMPRNPTGANSKEELTKAAIKHFREELTPRPPSYWSSSSNFNHSKKPTNRRSRKDLKDLDSYYVCGRSIGEQGIRYQVVWRDGYGFECSSDDEEEIGVDFGDDYMHFEDCDFLNYFFDKMPVSSSVDTSEENCDNITATGVSGDNRGEGEDSEIFLANDNDVLLIDNVPSVGTTDVKSEPDDSDVKKKDLNSSRRWADKVKVTEKAKEPPRTSAPLFIDLTDSP